MTRIEQTRVRMAKSIRHPRLGTFRFVEPGIWRAQVPVGEHKIRCDIVNLHGVDLAEPLAVMARIVDMLHDGTLDVSDAIVAQLLETYNSVWRDDDDPILSPTQFLAGLKFRGVTVTANDLYFFAGDRNLVTLTYDPDGMFCDHDVDVYLDDKANLLGVGLG